MIEKAYTKIGTIASKIKRNERVRIPTSDNKVVGENVKLFTCVLIPYKSP